MIHDHNSKVQFKGTIQRYNSSSIEWWVLEQRLFEWSWMRYVDIKKIYWIKVNVSELRELKIVYVWDFCQMSFINKICPYHREFFIKIMRTM